VSGPVTRVYTIDGSRFSTLEGFYDEVESVLIPGQYWGRNLDAFNDILFWPWEEGEAPYRLLWKNAALSRERLGDAFDQLVQIIRDNNAYVELTLE
jgi:RNAse (barnase) inhibitor barstar